MQTCADEPVHIPGTVQPFSYVFGVSIETSDITYASGNCSDLFGQHPLALIGLGGRDVLGPEVWHGVRNAVSLSTIAQQTAMAGEFVINNQSCIVRAHQSDNQYVIEIEPAAEATLDAAGAIKTLTYLTEQIQRCDTEAQLFNVTVEMLQHLTGYDRVLIYRFDANFDGEVLAEAKQRSMESFAGLRFPHWDIPHQARAIMARVPLRLIRDVSQEPVTLLGRPGLPALDTTLADCRGVSPIHQEYLRNMGVMGSMTLSVMVDGCLWGMISFHHRRPRLPEPTTRSLLTGFLLAFAGKLETLHQKSTLQRIKDLDNTLAHLQSPEDAEIRSILPTSAPLLMEVFKAHGIASLGAGEVVGLGALPDMEVIEALSALALSSNEILSVENLSNRLPDLVGKLYGVGGALVMGLHGDRTICLFRNVIEREVVWAGNPQKSIAAENGRVQLAPRTSFSTYLEQVTGECDTWSENDIYLLGHLRTHLRAADRQLLMNKLSRQQSLMIGELNHRVRNILTLVRSVSLQARKQHTSVESYANALEGRIEALAVAHDIASGKPDKPISISYLIRQQLKPFEPVMKKQVQIDGQGGYLRPDVTAVFSLVLHELTTNAVKYGALKDNDGRVIISIVLEENGYRLTWREQGGPKVAPPKEIGFGMGMIEQAVPHELGGTAKVAFEPQGFSADFLFPSQIFQPAPSDQPSDAPLVIQKTSTLPEVIDFLLSGNVMLLEDNFVIAKAMAVQIGELCAQDVSICATSEAALDLLTDEVPVFAVLDIDLGRGQTSMPVARKLLALGVPFIFVSGYGENSDLPEGLKDVPTLSKPLSSDEFRAAAAKFSKLR